MYTARVVASMFPYRRDTYYPESIIRGKPNGDGDPEQEKKCSDACFVVCRYHGTIPPEFAGYAQSIPSVAHAKCT